MTVGLCPIGRPLCWAIYSAVSCPLRGRGMPERFNHLLFYYLFYFQRRAGPRRHVCLFFALFDQRSSSIPSRETLQFLPFITIRPQQTFLRVRLTSIHLLLSPARVTRDSINSTFPNNPTFPLQAVPPNFLTSTVPPSLVHTYSLPLPA